MPYSAHYDPTNRMRTVGQDCNFECLPHLIVIFQILVPIVVGVPATLLIPNILQTETLIDWERERWYVDSEEQDDTRSVTSQLAPIC